MTLATYFCPDRKTWSGRRSVAAAATAVTRKAPNRTAFPLKAAHKASLPLTASQARLRAFRTHLLLWTLQAWLAMFFLGAAYAKLTEPMHLLVALLGWPGSISATGVRAVGAMELALGLAMMAPLVSWRVGGPVMMAAALVLAVLSGAMAAVHLARFEIGFATLNVVLALVAIALAGGRWSSSPPCLATAGGQR